MKLIKSAVALAMFATSVQAGNLTATDYCTTCMNVSDLGAAATAFKVANAAPPNTFFMVTSTVIAISMKYRVVRAHPFSTTDFTTIAVPQFTTSCNTVQACNLDAYNQDQAIYARAAKIAPITVQLPYTATADQVMAVLTQQIVWAPPINGIWGFGQEDLHGWGIYFPVIGYYDVVVNGGPVQYLFIGDLVRVNFGTSGYSQDYLFTGMGPPSPFNHGQAEFKPYGPIMYHGRPVTGPPSTVPATPLPNKNPATSGSSSYNWPPGASFSTTMDPYFCQGLSQITVGPLSDGQVITSTGAFDSGCPL